MSITDKVFRAIGIALTGSVLSWTASLGVAWIIECARHLPASVGSNPGWLIIPSALSFGSIIVGILSAAGLLALYVMA